MILYYSMTGNTKDFVDKLPFDTLSIKEYNTNDKFVLITPTYNFGQIPKPVEQFLKENSGNIIGVISGGNRNWGSYFGNAGNLVAQMCGVPLLYKFELKGTKQDLKQVTQIINNMQKEGWFN